MITKEQAIRLGFEFSGIAYDISELENSIFKRQKFNEDLKNFRRNGYKTIVVIEKNRNVYGKKRLIPTTKTIWKKQI